MLIFYLIVFVSIYLLHTHLGIFIPLGPRYFFLFSSFRFFHRVSLSIHNAVSSECISKSHQIQIQIQAL